MRRVSLSVLISIAVILIATNIFARPGWHRSERKGALSPKISVDGDSRTEPVYPTPEEGAGVVQKDFEWMPSGNDEPSVRVLSLDDCILLAVQRNRRLIAAGYEIEAARYRLKEAKALLWPVMEYKYRMAPVPKDVDDAFNKFFEGEVTLFNSLHVGIGVPLSSFGQLHTAQKMARGGIEAAQTKKVSTTYDTIFQVRKIYYGIQLAKETIKLLDEAVGGISKKIREEDAKEEKTMDPYDILQLKVFKVELERRLEEAKHNMELAFEGLKIQMDLDPHTDVHLDSYKLRPLIHEMDEEKEYIDIAMEHQPNSKLMNIGVEIKRQQYRLEKFKLAPKLGLGFFADVGRSVGFVRGLQSTDDFNDPFNYTRAGVGLQLSGNLDFHGAYAKIKRAKAEYFKSTYERHIARRGLSLEMKKAYLTTKRMRENVTRAKKAESIARQMTFLSKMNIDMGIGDNDKYADALKLLLLTRGQYFKAVFDFNTALAEVERRIGAEKYTQLISVPSMSEHEFFNIESAEDVGFEYYEDDHVDMEGIQNEDSQY